MKKTVIDLLLLENKQLNKDNFLLKLQSPISVSEIFPGQFVNIEIKEAGEIFLRRPFSVLDVDYQNQTISLLVKILGRGSKKLTEAKGGLTFSTILPLGKSFTMPSKNDRVLLIGGGSGVAPMLFLAKCCGLDPENVHVLIGARSAIDHIDIEDYQPLGKFYFTTEDGTLGEKGYVTNHSLFTNKLKEFTKIYACGPDLMMKAIGRIALENQIFCELSLENMMACGFGVCLCCVEDTKAGHKCVCTDGPVFNVNDLKW
ncbi:MAG TPA: dihydroorotate dehydrogenase electron transfer subunit [Prolixibacteraceae bacterium]|jgi:dihydroorotate dehydrogenase electron transfer subunit|nr:dihydroorotate dehydrogenase electron transfer subunit [Prolixibacteraceae bacterium]